MKYRSYKNIPEIGNLTSEEYIRQSATEILLRGRVETQYYVSLKKLFGRESDFEQIKIDLFKEICKRDCLDSRIIYDYKNNNIWVKPSIFENFVYVFQGFIPAVDLKDIPALAEEVIKRIGNLYSEMESIKRMDTKTLRAFIKDEETSAEDKVFYKQELKNRNPIFKLYYESMFRKKLKKAEKYHEEGRKLIKEIVESD